VLVANKRAGTLSGPITHRKIVADTRDGINRYILLISDKVSVFGDGSLWANHLEHQPPSPEGYLCLELGNHSLQFV